MQSSLGQPTPTAIGFFIFFVFVTLLITYWAARKTKTTSEFYAAGRSITGFQNGMALAGDYMSAASFLGISGLVALNGYDGMIYATGWLVGWPVLLFLIAEPLRNIGKYTFADVLAYRLKQGPVRIASAIGGIATLVFYAIAQMVGAGNLIKLMFGLSYELAVIIVGAVMLAYVLFGGMLATTWVQITKAGLLLGGITVLAVISLARFHFNPVEMFSAVAANYGQKALEPGGLITNPLDAVSLGLALMLGLLGMPHILMRFYTVPDAKEARKSIVYATGFIGYFYIIVPVVGFAASVLVGRNLITGIDRGGNMAAPLLAEMLGGTPFLGFIAAVAFATILAVVAGLTLAGASTLSHDIYVNVVKGGQAGEQEQIRVARVSTFIFGAVAILLGILFKGQNVAYMVGLAFAIAASANFPALLLSITWKKFTTAGATASILTGALLSLLLIYLSPTIQVDILKHPGAIFPLKNPAIVSMTASFLAAIVVSLLFPDRESEKMFEDGKVRTYLAVGSE